MSWISTKRVRFIVKVYQALSLTHHTVTTKSSLDERNKAREDRRAARLDAGADSYDEMELEMCYREEQLRLGVKVAVNCAA